MIKNKDLEFTKKAKVLLFRWLDVIIFTAVIILKNLYYGKQIDPVYFNVYKLIVPITCSVLMIIAIIVLCKEKKRARALLIFDIVISLILFIDTAYFRYFKDISSVGAMRNGTLLVGVSACLPTLVKFKDIIFILDLIVLFPFIKKFNAYKAERNYNLSMNARLAVFFAIFVIALSGNVRCIYDLNIEQPMLLSTMSNKLYTAKILGNIDYHIVDLYNCASNFVESHKPLSSENKIEIKNFLAENKTANSGTAMAGIGQGKNLIMIQVEALQGFVINRTLYGQEITPNLNRWIKKSMYFDNYFYQVSAGNTSDAEFMSNNSLYPAASGAAYYKYCDDTLDSLPKKLAEAGYSTNAFHGYVDSFWNRNLMYKTEGFQNYFAESSFNIDENVGLGLSDKSFFTQSLEKMQNLNQPYFSFLITLSSHYPYDGGAAYGDFNVGKYEGTLIGNYLKGIHYADEQLGMFLDQLEQNGTLDNSILVLYGDHYAIPKEYADQMYDLVGISNPTDLDWQLLQKVPMFIHFPGNEYKGVNHVYTGQMDLYPTLANMFNLNCDYIFGRDIFNAKSHEVILRNGSFTDGKVFYISGNNEYYDIKTKKVIQETETLKQKKEEALEELYMSDNLLNYNLIKKGDRKSVV